MTNVILQFFELDLVNVNVSAKFYQNIPNGLRVKSSLFTEFELRQNLDLSQMSFDYLMGLHHVNINVYAKFHHNIPLSSRDRAIFTFFRIWASATPRPIPNDILLSLGLHLVNINAYAKCYQNIPNGLRVIDIFHEQAGVKIFTNTPASKFSQTVRWQNQMLDYRAPYEIQLQVSVDFLRGSCNNRNGNVKHKTKQNSLHILPRSQYPI